MTPDPGLRFAFALFALTLLAALVARAAGCAPSYDGRSVEERAKENY